MFIQRIFHVRHDLDTTRRLLGDLCQYSPRREAMEKMIITSEGVAQIECALPSGEHTTCVLVELPSENPNQVLFQSTTGNIEVSGLLEFIPIRPNLTEVQLTVSYSPRSFLLRVRDLFCGDIRSYFDRQLNRLRDGLEAPALAVAS